MPSRPGATARRSIRARGQRMVILSLGLTIFGAIAILPPLVLIGHGRSEIFGLPGGWVYLFALWVALIVGAALIAPRLPAEQQAADKDVDA